MNNGIIQLKSIHNFETTYLKLKNALENHPLIKIVAELDHSQNANKVDLPLGKTKIILFGNPLLGTPLIQANITIAIDLPQKFIVFEQEENVSVAYNDPMYLKERHQIKGKDELLKKISNALKTFAEIATQ